MRYLRWMRGIIFDFNFGWSFQWNRTVNELIGERLPLTLTIAVLSLIVSWVIAIPIGIYSATHQYSFLDYIFTSFGFIGLATPGFLLDGHGLGDLTLLRFSPMGLYAVEYVGEPMSIAKFLTC